MTDTSFLFATGPCLTMALGAIALLLLGASLGSRRHAILWSVTFAASAVQWGMLALGVSAAGSSLPYLVASALGLAAMILYVEGFRLRRGHERWSRAFVGEVVLSVAVLGVMAALARDDPMRAAIPPMAKALLLGWALAKFFGRRFRPSVSEWAVATMLGGVVLVYAVTAILPVIHAHRPGTDWIVRIVGTAALYGPASAAIVLFTLLLIASDFSIERRRLVDTDPLTGVLNRLGFGRAARIASRRIDPLSIVIADIDGFKGINDRHGHAAGDVALTGFARRLADGLQPDEIAGRIGGEEFALVLAGRSETALARTEEMRVRINQLALAEAPGLRLTASFGVAQRRKGEDLPSAMARADEALYRSKRGGRDRSTLAEAD